MSNLIDLTSADSRCIEHGDLLATGNDVGASSAVAPSSGRLPPSAGPSPPVMMATPLVPSAPTVPRYAFMQHPLIVDQRSSFDSNPFDQAQHIADGFDDPFESVHSKALQKQRTHPPLATGAVSTATLIQLDSPSVKPPPPDDGGRTVPVSDDNAAEPDVFAASAGASDASANVSTGVVRLPDLDRSMASARNHSDSDISAMLKSIKSSATAQLANTKCRSASLDQLVRRNQLLKLSISNAQTAALLSPIGGRDSAAHSPLPLSASTTPVARGRPAGTGNDSFDDLMATSPRWLVDSEADDSDMEQLCIPFLAHGASATAAAAANVDESPMPEPVAVVPPDVGTEAAKPRAQKCLLNADRSQQLLDQLERHKAAAGMAPTTTSPPVMPVLLEETADEALAARLVDVPTVSVPSILVTSDADTPLPAAGRSVEEREHLASLLASVKQAIERFDNHSEAKAMLAGLNTALDMPPEAAGPDELTPAMPIVRQGTFNLEHQLVSPSSGSEQSSAIAEEDDDSGLQAGSVEVSPNTTNIASVVEQLGRMNLSRLHTNAPAATTYIVVMNTPAAAGATGATKARTKTSTPIIRVHNDGQAVAIVDDDSPSSYLKTRTSRSVSLSMAQKPSSVAQALAAKSEMRQRANNAAPTTPLRSSSTVRRSSFSQAGGTLAPPTTAAAPTASSLSSTASASTSLVTRRSIYSVSARSTSGTLANKSPKKSPHKIVKSPSKLSAYTRRSVVPSSTRSGAYSSSSSVAGPSTTGQPSLLKASAVPSTSQLKLRTCASVGVKAAGPLRATVPIRSSSSAIVTKPPGASTAAAASSSASSSATGLPVCTPRRSSALAHSTPAVKSIPVPSTPRTAYGGAVTSGLQRTSNIGYLSSATPAGKRLSTALSAGGQASTTGLARRRSMSEGKVTAASATTTTMSGLAVGGGSRLTTSVAGGRRLPTLSAAGRNKENQLPK